MDRQTAADPTPRSTSTLPRRGAAVAPEHGRRSALTAPEREKIDAFLLETRPWALRQARRSYRHLPESLREQAVDRACTELRTRAPESLERRALSAELAARLTDALRHVHVGWCLNESSALLRREGTEPSQPEVRREGLADFVDEGLGGLERAVLQLEIGAGRDTRTARAALRLGPRQYAAHREAGLSKLRAAISGQVVGRACDQHVAGIVAAATGDRAAMQALNAGRDRCRYCAREAQGLRSVLHERLAIAPWPIAIKPAGLLAVKLSALGAVYTGNTAGGVGAVGAAGGSGASAAATVLAAAALATGAAALASDDGQRDGAAERPAQITGDVTSRGKADARSARRTAARTAEARRAAARERQTSARRTQARRQTIPAAPSKPTTPTAAAAIPQTAATPSGAGAPAATGPVSGATDTVTHVVDNVAKPVTGKLPPVVAEPVGDTVDQVTGTVEDTAGVVDGLLKKP